MEVKDFDNAGLLEVSQKRASHKAARALIKLGVDVNQRTGKVEDTLLHKAARQGDIGFTAILLEAGAEPNIPNKYGRLPLQIAEQKKHEYLAGLLKEKGARTKSWTEYAKVSENGLAR